MFIWRSRLLIDHSGGSYSNTSIFNIEATLKKEKDKDLCLFGGMDLCLFGGIGYCVITLGFLLEYFDLILLLPYFLNMFHIFSLVCFLIYGVKSRSGHDRSQSFRPIWHVSGPEIVF